MGKGLEGGGEGGRRGDLKSEKGACFPNFNYKYKKKGKKKEKKVIANWNSVWHARVVVDVEIARSAKCPRGSLLVPRGLQRSAYMDFDGSLMMNFRYFF